MFIVTVALVSQAAIRGGMDVDDAFSYSDSYIQQCELLSSPGHFSRVFRKYASMNPGEYRLKYIK